MEVDDRQSRLSHRKAALALRSVTKLIAKNANLNDLINIQLDAENSPPLDSEEASWLNSIDLDK
jgi:hypothetical protein